MVKPSRRREMAQKAVDEKRVSIRLACWMFSIRETCYRYQPKLSSGNAEIADWLVRLTDNQRNWGFGLCFLHLRNVKGFTWNGNAPNFNGCNSRPWTSHSSVDINVKSSKVLYEALFRPP